MLGLAQVPIQIGRRQAVARDIPPASPSIRDDFEELAQGNQLPIEFRQLKSDVPVSRPKFEGTSILDAIGDWIRANRGEGRFHPPPPPAPPLMGSDTTSTVEEPPILLPPDSLNPGPPMLPPMKKRGKWSDI